MDRIYLKITAVPFKYISSDVEEESSSSLQERVVKAREILLEDFKDDDIFNNA